MIASILITLLVVVWVLGVLLNAGLSGMYANTPPTGDQAMGLIVPIFVVGIASAALMIATWISVWRGGFDWVSDTRSTTTLAATLVMFGVCLAAAGALGVWMEGKGTFGRAVAPIGMTCAVLIPLSAATLLMICAWMDPPQVHASAAPRWIGGALIAGALAGYGLGVIGLRAAVMHNARNRDASRAAERAFDEKWRQIREMPLSERIRSDLAEASPETPLWVFISRLPEAPDEATRRWIVDRALRTPNLLTDMENTMTCRHHLYRFGCAMLIAHAPPARRDQAWAGPLARSIRVTSAEIELHPTWLTETSPLNPDPHAHLQALIDASAALGHPVEPAAALRELAALMCRLAPGPARDHSMRLFDKLEK